jgi:SAM-dependent methyltransferase
MSANGPTEVWAKGAAYEPYIGRWSRLVAHEFLPSLGVEPDRRWLDVGCGTGMLTRAVLELAAPAEVVGIDPSEGFLAHARSRTTDARARFQTADALALPFEDESFDAVVSGLVLNFIPDAAAGVREMRRVSRPGGTIAAYVWDYADKMQMLRYFWDAALSLDPAAHAQDEGPRFNVCRPGGLRAVLEDAGLRDVDDRAIDAPTVFADFDDYWTPFLGQQGPAPAYVASLDEERRVALRERLRETLPTEQDGSIRLFARAWAAQGQR